MASSSQIKALLNSYADQDNDRFFAVALQVAAKEAQRGHHKVARDIRSLVEKLQHSQSQADKSQQPEQPTPLVTPQGELEELLEQLTPAVRRNELVLPEQVSSRIDGVIHEQRQKAKLAQYGLLPSRKLLLAGPPGTGKTMTASVLATELQLPLYTVRLDGLVTRYLGETASKLRKIFDQIAATRAIYLFDEFDAIGGERAQSNDVGEIRRVLNSFLQFLEKDTSESLIVAATNHPDLLDKALYRRFDQIIQYPMPDTREIEKLIQNRLVAFSLEQLNLSEAAKAAKGLSPADVTRCCEEAAKTSVLNGHPVNTQRLVEAFQERNTHR
ncbi:AAA family ATPase [Aidingimonas lacisalsi]|uniref:AAA family ATPase n=1 Tax=Aidingimonas lacisalsi TaxID=2604086 RepID=UPI0011D2A893|nr:ATP-binding protein [Aidingimonas lacisalsi]